MHFVDHNGIVHDPQTLEELEALLLVAWEEWRKGTDNVLEINRTFEYDKWAGEWYWVVSVYTGL